MTVVYNGQQNIEQTIKSVLEQSYKNVEYIIVDGGSTDNTLNILEQYDEFIDYWVSEPDTGIYNAMNKGISLCTGDYIAFMNADDWYNLDALEAVAYSLCNNRYDYVFGNNYLLNDNEPLRVIRPRLFKYKIDMPISHPTLFVKRSILLKLGFNEKYKILADYDLVLRLINNNYSYFYIDKTLTNFRCGGISTTTDLGKEYFKVLYDHFGLLHAIFRFIVRNNNPVVMFIGQIAIKLKLRVFFIKFYTFLSQPKK